MPLAGIVMRDQQHQQTFDSLTVEFEESVPGMRCYVMRGMVALQKGLTARQKNFT
jgi:predicted methyltransferase